MFCFGVLLPGFVLFGWTRNARDVTGMLGDGSGFVNPIGEAQLLTGDRNLNGSGGQDLSGEHFNKYQHKVAAPMESVIIFGETESGRASSSDGNNATDRRDFIRKVCSRCLIDL